MSTPDRPKSPVERMIDHAMRCTLCDAKAGACDCWTPCRCGWLYRKGEACRNPIHSSPRQRFIMTEFSGD